jgi:thermitase
MTLIFVAYSIEGETHMRIGQRIAMTVTGLLAALVLFSNSAFAGEQIPGEYLVKYKTQQHFFSAASIATTQHMYVADQNPYAKLLKVKVDMSHETDVLVSLLSNPNVEYVVPNQRVHAYSAPFDGVTLREQWAVKKVGIEAAWKRAGNRGSKNILVAVIDTGADYKHESLAQNMVTGFDFVSNTPDAMDKTGGQNPGHGTHCSGIIGATGLIDQGTVGMSPDVSIMPIRFLDENGSGDLNNGIKAIDFAIQKKVRVISASWGASIDRTQAAPLVEAVKRADDAGIIFVVAAANDGKDNDTTEVYPANAGYPNMIAVAASGPNDEKPYWSNYGTKTIHLAAPGLDIMSTLPGNKYQNLSGTSMATPLVSGLVAFLLAQDPSLTGEQMRALLQTTGAPVQIQTASNTRVDAAAATEAILGKKLFIAPAAATLKVGESMKFSGVHGAGNYSYAVANASVGSIAADGSFKATGKGDTTVAVKDSSGSSASSLQIHVVDGSSTPAPAPNPPDQPGTPGGDCPFGDQQTCDMICQIKPDLPFCHK